MGPLAALDQNLGLAVFTGVSVLLTAFLVYSMIHPERF